MSYHKGQTVLKTTTTKERTPANVLSQVRLDTICCLPWFCAVCDWLRLFCMILNARLFGLHLFSDQRLKFIQLCLLFTHCTLKARYALVTAHRKLIANN